MIHTNSQAIDSDAVSSASMADASADPNEHADADNRTSVDALRAELATIVTERANVTAALERAHQAAHDAFGQRDAAAVLGSFDEVARLEARLVDLNAQYDAAIVTIQLIVQDDVELWAVDARALCAKQHQDQQELIARIDRLVAALATAFDDALEQLWRRHQAERSGLIRRLNEIVERAAPAGITYPGIDWPPDGPVRLDRDRLVLQLSSLLRRLDVTP